MSAIEIAKRKNNIHLIAKSLFIKINAIERLGDYVQALPLTVLCKHLRPEVSDINIIETILPRHSAVAEGVLNFLYYIRNSLRTQTYFQRSFFSPEKKRLRNRAAKRFL